MLFCSELRAVLRGPSRIAVGLVLVLASVSFRSLLSLASAVRSLRQVVYRVNLLTLLGFLPAVIMAVCAICFASSREDARISWFAVLLPYSMSYLLSRLVRHVSRLPTLAPLVGLVASGGVLLSGLGALLPGSPRMLAIAWLALGYSFLGALVATIMPDWRPSPWGWLARRGRSRRRPPVDLP